MSNILVDDNPEFNQNMEALTPQTPAHADIFNAVFSQLLNNDYYLVLLADRLKEYADGTYRQATGYTDLKISQLVGGAPETLDTLKEVADAIKENETVVDALDAAVGKKAGKSEFDTHAGNSTIHITATERENWNSKASGSHTHVKKEITDFPTTMKNPNSLTLKLNGTSQGAYDGSEAKEVNITPSGIGAAASSHTHSYLPLAGGKMTGAINLNNYATLLNNILQAANGMNMYIGATDTHMIRFFEGSTSNVYLDLFKNSAGVGNIRLYNATNGKGHYIQENPELAGNYALYLPTGSGTLALSSSDIRLKENIKDTDINNALDIVNSIKFRQFDWKDSGEHQDIGFIADELEKIDPHLKLKGTGGYVGDDLTEEEKLNTENMNVKCIDTFYLMGYYGKAIQEMYDIIKEQQKEIEALKNR